MKKRLNCLWQGVVAVGMAAGWIGIARADVLTDDFSGAAIDGNKWFLPSYQSGQGQLVQTAGQLEFRGDVSPVYGRAGAGVVSRALGLTSASWSAEVKIRLDGGTDPFPFPGMSSNDFVSANFIVEPGNLGTGIYDEHAFEANLAYVDRSIFGGSGFGHALRQSGRINDVENDVIASLSSSGPVMLGFRIEYNETTRRLKFLYDTGSGFVQFGNELDTTAWNMVAGDYFFINVGGVAQTLTGNPPTTTYSVGAGQLYFDDFNASGAGITIIPEPTFGAPLVVLAMALIRATRRRHRCRAA